ncbi:hypothetical protein [Paraburkholderia sp. CI3]|uniref:hypothetical protein n=1 Tax=Paraburkholderia sp. CI3 TaxID=2991060 RepID=UPI003D20F862
MGEISNRTKFEQVIAAYATRCSLYPSKKLNLPLVGRIFLGATAIVTPPFIGGETIVMLRSALDLLRTMFMT